MATILILEDDNVDVRTLLAAVLRRDGHRVLEAGDVRQAEEVLDGHKIDCLVADIVLPGRQSGTDFAVTLQRAQPQVRVVFMSGWSDERAKDQENIATLPQGSFTFLPKPFGVGPFMDRVSRVSQRTACENCVGMAGPTRQGLPGMERRLKERSILGRLEKGERSVATKHRLRAGTIPFKRTSLYVLSACT